VTGRPRTLLLGLIGAGIDASRSPAMHEEEAAAHGLRCVYQRIDLDRLGLTAEDLPGLLTAAERMGFAGVNVTHPCKQAVMPFLTDCSDEARAIGSVNTVVFAGGRRAGYNTDCRGSGRVFATAFQASVSGASCSLAPAAQARQPRTRCSIWACAS
jgi:shikimate dehydrogenase